MRCWHSRPITDWSVRRQLAATAGAIKGDRTRNRRGPARGRRFGPDRRGRVPQRDGRGRSRAAGSDGHRRLKVRRRGRRARRCSPRRSSAGRTMPRCSTCSRRSRIPREPSGSAARSWPARRTASSVRHCRAAAAAEAVAREPRRRRRARPAPARAAGRVERRHFPLAAAPRALGRLPAGDADGATRASRSRSPRSRRSLASSAEGGDLGKRAAAVLERVGWPGKPGMAADTAAPLTGAEQQRFEAGQVVYKTVCEACHQPDGRGREKLAPSLVGSELALAAPGIPARILLNGKEGSVGLMPPLGAGMTDEQIADVLTYVRRAWGQNAAPVAPAAVTDGARPGHRPHPAVDQRRAPEDHQQRGTVSRRC